MKLSPLTIAIGTVLYSASFIRANNNGPIKPALEYAYSVKIFTKTEATGIPVRGGSQDEIIAINGTISGPLLNATLVTEIFTETTFPGTDGSYVELANRYVWYTTDGVPFAGHEIGFVNARGTITKPTTYFAGQYAYLSEQFLMCYAPPAPPSDVVAIDCFIVG